MPPPPPLKPPAPKTEAELLDMKINQTTDDSLAATRRMMALCEEGKEAGIKCLVALDDQGEQLENVEKGMVQIDEDMKQAETALKGMDTCCFGICTNPFTKGGEFKGKVIRLLRGKDEKSGGTEPPPGAAFKMEGVPTYGGFIGRYVEKDAREDEMESNMEQVSNAVGNLRNMAIDIGSEVDSQNRQLERLNSMAASNEARVGVAVEKADKLIKA